MKSSAMTFVTSHRRFGIVAALLLLLALLQPSVALAHASLIASAPADDALVMRAPPSVRLTFNEEIEVLSVNLIDATGAITPAKAIEPIGTSLVVTPASPLGDGAHVVSWRVISADGHPVGGSLTFWVGQRGTKAPDVAATQDNALRVAIWSARWVVYAGLFFGVGSTFFAAWFGSDGASMRIAQAACLLGLIAGMISIGLQGLDVMEAPLSSLGVWRIWQAGLHGSFGRAAGLGIASFVAALLSSLNRPFVARMLSLAALIGVGAMLAATGHASDAPPRVLTTGAVFVHGVSLAFWIGALLPLGMGLRDTGVRSIDLLMKFSRWIPVAVAVLLVSGIGLSVVQVQRPEALWTTNYGIVLSVKLALVAVLLALALWNRLHLTPRIAGADERAARLLRGSIILEIVLVAIILGIVGLWRFTPPPRVMAAPESFFTHIHTDKAMANVTMMPNSDGSVDIAVELETGDERPLSAMGLSVTLSNSKAGIEPYTADAKRTDDGQWHVRMSAPVQGRWDMQLGVLISDFDKVILDAPVAIKR